MPIQIILIIIFVLAILTVIWRYSTHDLSVRAMVLWILFWLGGIVVVGKPDVTFRFARFLGVQRGADAVIYAAFTLVFFILFRLLLRIERLQKEITLLNRQVTLLSAERDKK